MDSNFDLLESLCPVERGGGRFLLKAWQHCCACALHLQN